MTSNVWNIYDTDRVYEIRANTLSVSLFETLVSNRPFIWNYQQVFKQRHEKNICEGLEWMCKLFKINAQQDF